MIAGCLQILAMATAVAVAAGPALPHTEAETLSGKKIVLPDAVTGHLTILVIAFTKRSQSQTTAWSTQLAHDYAAEPGLERYSIAVLDDVPGFIRGMVASAIRRGVPTDQHDSFLLIFQDAKPLRELTNVTNPDDAYVILLDRTSHVIAHAHGSPERAYAVFQTEIHHALSS